MIENTYVGLVHYPVYNKHHEVVTTSITNMDLHDISRSCKTYGINTFFIINPQESQRAMFLKLKEYWNTKGARGFNIHRSHAFDIIEYVPNIATAQQWIKERFEKDPIVITTSARKKPGGLNYAEIRDKIRHSYPKLLLFGTGHGLTNEIIIQSNFHLDPITGIYEYNHLSVRSAVAITLDRLFGIYK